MKKTKLYLDTSVPSFLFADDSPDQDDALHIALATFNEADALISWNFKHIVRLKTIRGINGINRMLGFRELEILTPQSLIQGDNND